MIKTQFHVVVKCFRIDNAMELGCSNFGQFYFQNSTTYTPHQNELVERNHKHCLEVSRALYF